MRFKKRNCPKCGAEAKGTVDRIIGVALIDFNEDGDAEYFGQTDVNWDSQETVTDKHGRVMLTCPKGHDWYTYVMFDLQLPKEVK